MKLHIPQGTSINMMNILLNISAEPSLYDLKRYDPQGFLKDITHMKLIANTKPANSHADKKLSLDDVSVWFSDNEKLVRIWKNMHLEHLSNEYGEHLVFYVTAQWAKENEIANSHADLMRLIKRQVKGLVHGRPATADVMNNLVLGWITYERTGDYVYVHNMQSQLEIIWSLIRDFYFRHFQNGEVVEILLSEAMRLWLNDGVTTVELASWRAKVEQKQKHAKDVFSKLPRRNAFKLNSDEKAWRFTVPK